MKTDIDTNFSFDLPKNRSNVMKVMGIGGGGSNAVNYMYKQGFLHKSKLRADISKVTSCLNDFFIKNKLRAYIYKVS